MDNRRVTVLVVAALGDRRGPSPGLGATSYTFCNGACESISSQSAYGAAQTMLFTTQEITMVRKIRVLSLLAILLAAPSTYAQTPPAVAAPAAGTAVDQASIQALRDMGAFLQTLKRFWVSTELTGERVLADGQKLQHTATADMDVERPNKLHALMHSARSERELIYDGKTVTLYTPAQKYYSTIEFVDTIGGLINRLEERFGVNCRCRISSFGARRQRQSTRSSRQ